MSTRCRRGYLTLKSFCCNPHCTLWGVQMSLKWKYAIAPLSLFLSLSLSLHNYICVCGHHLVFSWELLYSTIKYANIGWLPKSNFDLWHSSKIWKCPHGMYPCHSSKLFFCVALFKLRRMKCKNYKAYATSIIIKDITLTFYFIR